MTILFKVFQSINPQKVIILIDEPQNIYQRLLARDNTRYCVNLLDDMQQEEVTQAKRISKLLEIPCVIIDINETEDSEQLIYEEYSKISSKRDNF